MNSKHHRASSAIAAMDDKWFHELEQLTNRPWSQVAGLLRGAVLAYWQEALRGIDPRLQRIERLRAAEQAKFQQWQRALSLTDQPYANWRGHALSDLPVVKLAKPAMPGMVEVDNSKPVDQLIFVVAMLHTQIGGQPGISRTGQMANALRHVYHMLPDTLPKRRPATEDAFVKHAENTRRVWQRTVSQYQDYPKT